MPREVWSRAIVAAAVCLLAATANADPTTDAAARWKHGSALYDLGRYKEAIAEFEAAYELDPDPSYLFAIAQANRLDKNFDRAIELFRRYLDLRPDDPKRADILIAIDELEKAKAAKLVADKAAADKAVADKIAADKAAADKLAMELAANRAAADNKHIRIAVDVGLSIIYLKGIADDGGSPTLGGRIAVSYVKRVGPYAFDFGGSWQITTIPYEQLGSDGSRVASASVFFSQLHATAAITRRIAGPIWGRAGLGLGVSAFGNLQRGNPVITAMEGHDDVRMPCGRLDLAAGYRYNQTIDFVLGLASASVSGTNSKLRPDLERITTFETFYLGVYIKI